MPDLSSVTINDNDSGLVVSCTACGKELDRVPTLAAAYNRAGLYAHKCWRSCQVCESNEREELHQITFSTGDLQTVSSCLKCGMVYAAEPPSADYKEASIYARPCALGSGDTPSDRDRFRGTVKILSYYFPENEISILDVGCAQGGLLRELDFSGYENAVGMDPSQACVDACMKKDLLAIRGSLEDAPAGLYDLVTASHVLEHVFDVPKALESIRARVKEGGFVYIEVPNAMKYAEAAIPFLDLNREHINHFSLSLLCEALRRHNFELVAAGERILTLFGNNYHAIYVIAKKRSPLVNAILKYIEKSKSQMLAIDAILQPRIAGLDIILWGYGEFAQQLLATDALRSARVIQVVDSDPSKHGLLLNGVLVEAPEKIKSSATILIASLVNADSIQRDCQRFGLSNPVIRVAR